MEKVRLSKIAQISAGQAAPKEFSDFGLPFIRAGHLEELIDGKKLNELPKVNDDIAKKNKLKVIPAGSILFAKSGMSATKNRIFITTENSYYVSHLAAVIPSPKYDSSYLARFLSWYNPTNLILDNAYPSIRLEDINNLEIPLPNLATQQHIAAILDQADAIIQNNRAIVQKYDALTQSLFLDMFGDPVRNEKGWEKRKLNDFLEVLVDVGSNGGNDWVSANIKMKDEEDYALMIRTVNLNKNDFENNLKYVSEETYNLFKKTKVYGGEIIMNKIGSAGEFWLMPYLNRPVSLGLNQLMMTFKNLDKFYFYFYFSTNYGKRLINSKLNGATTKSITKTALRDLDILYPPMELQNQFAERVAMIEAQKQQAQLELAKSEELFASLLQRAFNGELS